MRTPSIKALKYWHEVYTKVNEIPELNASFSCSSEIAKIGGREEDPKLMTDLLMSHPFAGFFYGFLDESDTSFYRVSVIHHAFKLEPEGIDFDVNTHMAYGIEGLGKATAVVEIPTAMFEPSGDRVTGFITPSINDFIEAASDSDKIKYLSGNTQLKISKASLGSGFDANNVPIPLALPRRFGIIPPLLMPAFRTGCSVDIMSACLTIIKDFGMENLNEEGRLEFWIACYPTLQLL